MVAAQGAHPAEPAALAVVASVVVLAEEPVRPVALAALV